MPLTAAQADALRTASPDLLPSTEVRGQPELRYEDYGVGDPGPGRRWIIDEGALVLFDTRRGIQIYRKPIGEVVAPQVQEYEEEPPLRPTVPLTAKEPGDVTFQPQGDDLDFGALTPPRPTVPIQSPPPDGVSHQPQGRDLDFGEAPPPPVGGRRFEGSPPTEEERQLRRSASEPEISDDIADTSLTSLPALPKTDPEGPMIKLPGDEEPRRATTLETPTELRPVPMPRIAAAADSLKTMLDSTAEATGGTQDPTGGVIVTEESLLAESTPTDDVLTSDRQLVIDPSINEAWIVEDGAELYRFHIGTGDTTGTRFGEQYFTPHGTFNIMSQVPYEKAEGSFGPMWMALAHESGEKLTGPGGGGIGLHGQHAAADLNPDGPGFANQGFVSHGCIRFEGDDILKVGEFLDVGAQVTILPYHREGGKASPQQEGDVISALGGESFIDEEGYQEMPSELTAVIADFNRRYGSDPSPAMMDLLLRSYDRVQAQQPDR